MSRVAPTPRFNLDLGFGDTHVLITGGNGLIGRTVVQAFMAAGLKDSNVSLLDDLTAGTELVPAELQFKLKILKGDITKDLTEVFDQAERQSGTVTCCVALAGLDLSVLEQPESLCDMKASTWQRVFDVNIHGTFNTCQQWLRGIRFAANTECEAIIMQNVSLIIVGSEAGRFGVRTMAPYAAAKAAVQYGLLPSLVQDAARIWPTARVNAIAPGAVDTPRFREEVQRYGEEWKWKECEATVPLARPVPAEDVARTILFLASERYSGSVNGQVIPIDAGKMGSVVWTPSELAHEDRLEQKRLAHWYDH